VPVDRVNRGEPTSTATVSGPAGRGRRRHRVDEKDLRIRRFRSGGPGGHSVNTTRLGDPHQPSAAALSFSVRDEKSQHKNKAKA